MSEISQRIGALSPEKLALLSQRLKEKNKQQATKVGIPQRADSSSYPLSLEQQRLWFMDQLQPESSFYNMGGAMRLAGDLDVAILEQTLTEIVRRHEALRSSFPNVQGAPVQIVAAPTPIKLTVNDLNDFASSEREAVVARLVNEETERPFDLATGPLFRAKLWRLGPREHVLLILMHHIVGDGWSIGVFLRELASLYTAYFEGHSSPLPELSIQYADYAAWQRQRLTETTLEKQLTYWKRQLKGSNAALNLPLDFQRPAVSTNRAGVESFELSPLTVKALEELSQQENVTLFMTLLAAFYVLLHRYTAQQDMNLATPVLGRNQVETEQLIGFFINALVLRGDLSGNPTFHELLQRVREMLLDAQSNQEVPFERVVEALQPERTLVQMPLCQAVFRMESIPVDSNFELPELTIAPFSVSGETIEYDLICSAAKHGDQLITTLIYSADLFNAATIKRFGTHFQRLLDAIVSNPEQRLSEIQFLDETERRQVLIDWNATTVDYPKDKCVQQLFEAQVAETPNAIALVFQDQKLTYHELNSRANQLAHHLRELGVQKEMLVGLCVERSVEMIVGMLGILKAGAAFVPLDPSYPMDRLSFMFEDAQLPVLLTQEHLAATLPCQWMQTICLDSDWDLIATQSDANLDGVSEIDNLAYVIYTSGSTGKPKGVMLQHTGVGNMGLALSRGWHIGRDSRVLQFASFSFDASVTEVFMALLAGARLYLGSRESLMPGPELLKTLNENEITTCILPPSLLAAMDPEQVPALKVIIAAGENSSLETVERWSRTKRFFDAYGPTEDTVCATFGELDGSRVTIGAPIANNQVYILDKNLEPVPVGVFGELHIGGVGLARGYLNRPELTAEKFIANPFGDGSRLYKSGDLARWLPDGNIDFFGRIDNQLKVRGYRIEAGEIEAVLNSHPEVSTSVVVARENSTGEKRLAAYYIPQASERDEFLAGGQMELGTGGSVQSHDLSKKLKSHLQESLPDYMIPSYFVMIDSLPLTPNGKIDHRALPQPDLNNAAASVAFTAPRNQIEEILAESWSQGLNVARVGIDDNFFELGGDSIRSLQVLAKAQERGLEVSVQQLFKYQTIRKLAEQLDTPAAAAEVLPRIEPFGMISEDDRQKIPPHVVDAYPLTAMQAGMVFQSDLQRGDALYHAVNSFHLKVPFDRDALQSALQQFAETFEVMRISFDLANFSEPLQLVHDTVQIPLGVDDLRALSLSEQEKSIAEWLRVDRYSRLDLTEAPLLRFHVHRRTDESLQFTFTAHHAIFDGWSDAVFLTELLKLYLEIIEKGSVVVSPLPVSFRDYIALEKEASSSEESRQFWLDWLGDADTSKAPSWSNSQPDKIVERFNSAQILFAPEFGQKLSELARSRHVTLKSILLAAHLHVCALLSGRKDVVTGLVSNGRPEVDGAERIIGLFLNTLPFRAHLSGGTWEDLIQETFTGELKTVPHRRYPLAQIQLDNGGQTLFDTCFNYTHFHVYQQLEEVSQLELLGMNGGTAETEFAVSSNFNVDLRNSYIELHLICDGHQLHPEQIKSIGDYYTATLEEIANNPSGRYEMHSPLTPVERRRLLVEWNDTAADYSTDTTVHQLFEAQADRTPDALALRFVGVELSYREMNERANQLARHLRQQGVGAESRVGISMLRSFDMWISVLGVLKAGAAYVPLDPAYPRERIAYMLRDSKVQVLLTHEHLVSELPIEDVQVVCLDTDWDLISNNSGESLSTLSTAENLAYVIYTSGSTGQPKGVAMTHRALANLMQWQAKRTGSPQRTLQFASLSFDVSFQEALSAWCGGGSVVLITEEQRRDGRELLRVLIDDEVEHLCVPFVALNYLAEAADAQGVWPHRLRQVMSAGEQLKTTESVRKFFENLPGCTLDNQCGPSETHAAAAFMLPDSISAWPVLPPIGRPLANVRFYVLDERMQPVPVGVPGELYIGGVGLSRGYLDRPGMTAERYIPNPFSNNGERLFRSGDIVRYWPAGEIEWLWRKDAQVKIRGFRVELGEIENLLASHELVSDVCVIVREDVPGDKRLVAYVVGREGQSPANEVLRSYLQERLPVYMVPSAFVALEKLPLTPSGKVNRRALPLPEASDEIAADSSYEAPRNPLEELLCGIWAEVLKVREVGVAGNFFDMGGHSLSAIQLISRVREALRVEVSLQRLFDQPTVRAMTEEIEVALRGGPDLSIGRIERVDRNSSLPLSYAQQRLWFIHQLDSADVSYHIPMSVSLKGRLDVPALERTLTEVVRRHESLRTTFGVDDGEPVQVIHPPMHFNLEVLRDLTDFSDTDKEIETQRLVTEEARRPFDLANGPLIRASLIRRADDEHVLLATMHHIVSDGWSINVLMREVAALYEAYTNDATSPLPELEVHYADFAAWQRSWLEGEALDKQLSYWREQLSGAPAVLELPTDRPRPAVQSNSGATRSTILSAGVTQSLKELSRREGVTLFMTLLAAWQTLLAKYSGQTDIVVGSPVASRNRVETEALIGFFVNTLVLRSDLAGDPSFRELLKRVRGVTVGAYAHQDVPFEKLVEELQPTRSMSHSPLFQVMFTLQNISVGGEVRRLPELEMSAWDSEHETAKFDLTLAANEINGELDCTIEYKTDLFDAGTIEQMLQHLSRLLSSAAANPHQRLSELEMLSDDEKERILVEFNDTATEFPASPSLHELFEQQVQLAPENVALIFESQRLTYRELNTRANQLAHRLRRLGVGPDVLVGVMMERSIEMVVALLGIIKAGGAYVPIDSEYPAQRLSFMMSDASIGILLTQSHLLDLLPSERPDVVITLDDTEDLSTESIENPVSVMREQNLAYCIYTSGSTGQPKGAMNTHAGICNRLHWMQATYQLTARDRVLQKTTFSFDVSVWEFFWPLITGAQLVMARPGGHRDTSYLVNVIREQSITTMHFVPSMLQVFLEDEAVESCGSLQRVICSGEALPFDLQQRFFARLPQVELHNLYGPTEAAVDVTWWPCDAESDSGVVPIGKAIANTEMYVLDPQMNAVPPGVAGELYIGGTQLARGYLDRPALTAEKFVPHPFSREVGARLYRTGDLATFQPDGNIRYLGRLDHQVKVRGYRIELGEIEGTLAQHPAVQEAVVITRQYNSDDQRLIAYVVPDRKRAAVVRRLLQMEREGRADTKPYTLPNGMAVFHQNANETDFVYNEIFEQQVYLKHGVTLAAGDCILDVGANIGLFTLFVGQRCKDATIYAFEPIPPVFNSLRQNVELYDMDVNLLECGVSATEHQDTFDFYPHATLLSSRYTDETEVHQVVKSFIRNQQNDSDAALPSESLLDELVAERLQVERYTCELRPLSDVIREFNIECIDLLKIDVEKSELDVLAGIAEEDWSRIKQVIVEVHDIEGRLEMVSDLLVSRGYSLEVEQDRLLEGTGLHNVYAVRPAESRRVLPAEVTDDESVWMSADTLLDEVRGFLKDRLPSYMIPSAIVLLESIPLTPNGKLDRGALPEPAQTRNESSANFVGPRDELEFQLAQIWEEVLNARSISVKDNFFDRGGHSLLAVRLLSRVRRVLNVELPLSVFFKQPPTIEQMAAYLRGQSEPEQQQYTPVVAIQRGAADVSAFFCVHPSGGNVLCYARLARHLGPNQPVYGLEAHGVHPGQAPLQSVPEMAAAYVEAIRAVQPAGPYQLGGWSMGGVVAYEMAQQLQAQGHEVSLLALIDTSVPASVRAMGEPDELSLMVLFAQDMGLSWRELEVSLEEIVKLDWQDQLARLLELAIAAGVVPPDLERSQIERLYHVFKTNVRAMLAYTPQRFAGRVTLFKAEEPLPGTAAEHSWEEFAEDGVELHRVPGNHFTLIRDPHVRSLAASLAQCIAKVESLSVV